MAAIDPSADPDFEAADDKKPARATLKLVRLPFDEDDDDDDSEDEDFDLDGLLDGDEDESSEDDEEVNGGPSEKKTKKQAADEDDEDEDMEDEDDEDDDDPEATMKAIEELKKIMMAAKGKGKAVDGEDDEDDDEEDSDDESLELDEVVICTLDPEKVCPYIFPKLTLAKADSRTTNNPSTSWLAKAKRSSSRSRARTLSTSPATT